MYASTKVSEKQRDQRYSENAVKDISTRGNGTKKQWEDAGAEEKRNFKRIDTRIDVRFYYGRKFFAGTVTCLSANGMFIQTRTGFPLKAKFDVLIKVKNRIVNVPVSIAGRRRSYHFPPGIGVSVLHTSGDYLELLMQSNRNCLP